MPIRLLNILTLSFLALLLQGCPNTNFTITSPENGDAFEDATPSLYEFTYANAEPESVALNGVNITEYFEMANGVGTADGEALEAFLKQGNNTLTVEPGNFGPRVEFFVDTEGPSIIITEVDGDATKIITGKVQDPSGVNELRVNGISASLNGEEEFSITVPSSETYSFVASDYYGRESNTHYAARDTVLEGGLKVRVSQKAIDEILPVAQEIIEDLDFNALLADEDSSSLTLFRESIGVSLPQVTLVPQVCLPEVCTPKVCVFGVCTPQICTPGACTPAVTAGPVSFSIVEIEASLANVDVEEVDVDTLDIASGSKPLIGDWSGLSLDGTLTNTNIAIRIDSYLLGVTNVVSGILDLLSLEDELDALDGNFTVSVSADRLRLAADLGLTASNGDVDVTVADINAIGLNDFNSDFNTSIDLPDAFNLFGFGLAQSVLDVITGGIADARDFMLELILGNIVPLIADPIVDSLIEELRFGVKIGVTNNTLINALFQVRDINVVDNDSALLVGVDSLIGAEEGDVDTIDTGFSVGSSPDVLWVSDHVLPDGADLESQIGPSPDIAPQALGYRFNGAMTGTPDSNGGDVSVISSVSLINQALLGFYETALLQLSVGYKEGILSTEVDPDYTHRMVVLPATPPEMVFKGSVPAVAYLGVNNFQIVIQEKQANESWVDIEVFTIDADIPVVIGVQDNRLNIGLMTTDLDVVVTNNDVSNFSLFSMNNFLNRVFVSILIEQINLGLSNIDIPGAFNLEAGNAAVETSVDEISVTSENNLQIDINLNNI